MKERQSKCMSEYTLSNSDLRFLFYIYKRGMKLIKDHFIEEKQYIIGNQLFGLYLTYDMSITLPAYGRGELCLFHYWKCSRKLEDCVKYGNHMFLSPLSFYNIPPYHLGYILSFKPKNIDERKTI